MKHRRRPSLSPDPPLPSPHRVLGLGRWVGRSPNFAPPTCEVEGRKGEGRGRKVGFVGLIVLPPFFVRKGTFREKRSDAFRSLKLSR